MKMDLSIVIHPIRMRIVQALTNRNMTIEKIGLSLPDVPQASLYRHVKKLFDAHILIVKNETKIRGTIEKTYALSSEYMNTSTDTNDLSSEDYRKLFSAFLANLNSEFNQYVSNENIDPKKDGVGFRLAYLYVSDHEFNHFLELIKSAFSTVIHNEPNVERKRISVANIFIPHKECD